MDIGEHIRQHRVIERFLMAAALAILTAMFLFFGGYLYGAVTTTELDPPLSAGTNLLLGWWPVPFLVFAFVYATGGRHVS